MKDYGSREKNDARSLVGGYAEFARQLEKKQRLPYLLSFMFHRIRGADAEVWRQMAGELERVFATLLTRIHRKPRSASARGHLPVWICTPDYPVFKHDKQPLKSLVVNNGRHFHAIAFMPVKSRLAGGLGTHFDAHRALYLRNALARIHVEPITYDLPHVVDYVLKALKSTRTNADDLLILPRTLSEMS